MLNGASMYSIPCKRVKIVANSTVNNNAIIACFFARTIIAWCAQVTVAPELKRKNVLVKGIPDVWIVWIASGGHTPPKLKTGDKLEWKKAQKNAKKNIEKMKHWKKQGIFRRKGSSPSTGNILLKSSLESEPLQKNKGQMKQNTFLWDK